MNFNEFQQAIPQAIAQQVQAAAERLLPDAYTREQYEEQFLIAAIACCSTEIGYDLWWKGNELYGQLTSEKQP